MPRLADALHRAPNPPLRSRLQRPLPDWLQRPAGAGALTLGVHALMLLWLLAGDRQNLPPATEEALQIEWIVRTPVASPIPPMPVAPARPADSRVPSAAVTPARSPQPALAVDEAPALDAPPPGPARPLSAQIGAFVREGAPAAQYERGPLDRPSQVLPGRGEAIVEGFHVREELSPSDRVQMVLSLVGLGGGGGATCADLRRKMVSDISDEERRKLIDDERRICRRGQAGTFR
jgi:hypothetical protein